MRESGHKGMAKRTSVSRPVLPKLFLGAISVVWLAWSACGSSDSPQPAEDPSPHSDAFLILETETVRPDEPFVVGLRFEFEPEWHSYWLNPGDAGQPASIHWNLPDGFRVGDVHWPFPRVVEESSVVSYGYVDETMLLVEVFPGNAVDVGQEVMLEAEVHWLVCSNICLPASANLVLEIEVDDVSPVPDEEWQPVFSATRRDLPRESDAWTMSATQSDSVVVLLLTPADSHPTPVDEAIFFAFDRRTVAHTEPQTLTRADGATNLQLRKSRFLQTPLERLHGVLVVSGQGSTDQNRAKAYTVDVAVGEGDNR